MIIKNVFSLMVLTIPTLQKWIVVIPISTSRTSCGRIINFLNIFYIKNFTFVFTGKHALVVIFSFCYFFSVFINNTDRRTNFTTLMWVCISTIYYVCVNFKKNMFEFIGKHKQLQINSKHLLYSNILKVKKHKKRNLIKNRFKN